MKEYQLLSTEHIKLTNRQHSTEIVLFLIFIYFGLWQPFDSFCPSAHGTDSTIWAKIKLYWLDSFEETYVWSIERKEKAIMTVSLWHTQHNSTWDREKRWAKEIKTKGTLMGSIGMPTVEAINQMCSLDLITITSGSIWNSKQILTFIHGFPFSWAMVELVEMHLSKGNLNRINAS